MAITPSQDPGEFAFEILNEDSGLVEVLLINVVEVVTILSLADQVGDGGACSMTDQLAAIRKCARPRAVVSELPDHVLMAKFAAAVMNLENLGKEPGSQPSLPTHTGSSSSLLGSQTKNMSTA